MPRLRWTADDTATVEPDAVGDEVITILLLRALKQYASAQAGDSPVSPVSVTLDTTAKAEEGAPLRCALSLDRRTRTLVFANGAAIKGDRTVMTATAVYRIGA